MVPSTKLFSVLGSFIKKAAQKKFPQYNVGTKDLTGVCPTQVTGLISEVLGVHEGSIVDVTFVYDDGFERLDLAAIQSDADLQTFLASNADDCKVEARFAEILGDHMNPKIGGLTWPIGSFCPDSALKSPNIGVMYPMLLYSSIKVYEP